MHSWAPRSAARQANLAIVLFRPPSSPPPPKTPRVTLAPVLPSPHVTVSKWVPLQCLASSVANCHQTHQPTCYLAIFICLQQKASTEEQTSPGWFCPDDSVCNWFPDNAVVPNCYIGVHSTGRSKVQSCDKIFGGRGIKMMYEYMNWQRSAQGYYREGVALQCLGRHAEALAAFSSGLAQVSITNYNLIMRNMRPRFVWAILTLLPFPRIPSLFSCWPDLLRLQWSRPSEVKCGS